MKKAITAFFAALLSITALYGALAADKTSKPAIKTVDNYIAVFDFEVTTGDKGISRPLADKVIHELSMSDKYEVIDRGNMNKILKEQKFQMTGCVAQECKVEAGQILGVGKIVNGSVGIVGKTYYLTLQLIDVKTGKVMLSAEDECRCEIDELLGSTRRLAKKLLGEKVEQPVSTAPKPVSVAESKANAEADAIAKAEEIERAKAAQIAKAKAEAEEAAREKARAEAISRAKAEEIERVKAAQIARAKAEEERIKAEQVTRAKAEEERIKAERIAKTKAEEEKIKAEEAARAKAEEERIKAEKAARAKAEEERIKAERAAKTRAEAEAKQAGLKTVTASIAKPGVGSGVVASDGRFEKLASGVLRDTQSGLEWYAGPDKNTVWDDAKSWAANLRVDGGGWRMPTITELKSLYQKSAGSRNMTSLLETTGWLIWSEKTAGPGGVLALDFGDGRDIFAGRGDSIDRRSFAVRSTPKPSTKQIDTAMVSATIVAPDGRFEKLASGVVRDTQSGLEWYAGPDINTSWDDAKSWVANLIIDSGGWRMPTITELKSLYQKGAGSRNMTSLLETTGWLIWSEKTAGPGGVLALDFGDGRDIFAGRGDSVNKRGYAVRSTPKAATARIDPAVVSTTVIASDGKYEKLTSGVVRDTQSGLDWYAGPDKNTVWEDASSWVVGLRVDGGGWRMPKLTELKGLYQKGVGSRNMTPLLETTGWLIWSIPTGSLSAEFLDFGNGFESNTYRNEPIYKRGFAVRSRK